MHRSLLRSIPAIVCILAWMPALIAARSPGTAAGIRLIGADRDGVTITVATPTYQLTDASASITIPGAIADPDYPAMPLVSVAIGAPPGASLDLQVHTVSRQNQTLRHNLPDTCTLPAARISGDALLRGQRIVTLAISPLRYCPADATLHWDRELRLELRWQGGDPVGFSPDPLLDELLATSLLNDQQARSLRARPSAALQSALPIPSAERYKISIEQGGIYRIDYADLLAAGVPIDQFDPRLLQLSNRGKPVAISISGEADGRFDPQDYLIFYGQPIGDLVPQDSVILDGTLLITDTLMSADYSAESLYTRSNVYWLEYSATPGLRMAELPAAPQPAAPLAAAFRERLRAEDQYLWWTTHFTGRDIWVWERLSAASVITGTYPIDLPHPAPNGSPAEVHAEIVAFSHSPTIAPDHRTRVLLNNALVEDTTWDGPTRHAALGNLPAATLKHGPNQLAVGVYRQPGTGVDSLYFDWFSVAYDRLFLADADRLEWLYEAAGTWRFSVGALSDPDVLGLDVSDPLAPRLLRDMAITDDGISYRADFSATIAAPRRFALAAGSGLLQATAIERRHDPGLHAASNRADYIFIAHSSLLDATQAFAEYRTSRGLRTMVVDLADVIDFFNNGIYHPIAIKRFLAYAYQNWQGPAPQYVMLVGDGHWNSRGIRPERYGSDPILMPPNLAWVDPWQGQVDSSNQLAAIVGNDILPDLAIGRLPARTPADVAAVLAKTIAHEQAPSDAAWRERLLFVADNGPDSAGDFATGLEIAINNDVPTQHLAIDRLYLDDLCGPAQNPPQPCPEHTSALSAALNVTGTLMLTYAGHGAIDSWAKEQVFTREDVANLQNADRPPFLLSLDCLDGYWSYPGNDSLIETLLRAPNGGVAAAFAPTGLGLASGHDRLQRGLYQALFNGTPQIGQAAIAARLALFSSGSNLDLIDTYTIFGDPAMRLAMPEVLQPTPTPTATMPTNGPGTPSPTTTPTATATGGPNNLLRRTYLPQIDRPRLP